MIGKLEIVINSLRADESYHLTEMALWYALDGFFVISVTDQALVVRIEGTEEAVTSFMDYVRSKEQSIELKEYSGHVPMLEEYLMFFLMSESAKLDNIFRDTSLSGEKPKEIK